MDTKYPVPPLPRGPQPAGGPHTRVWATLTGMAVLLWLVRLPVELVVAVLAGVLEGLDDWWDARPWRW